MDAVEYRAAALAEKPWARVLAAIPVTAEELEARSSPDDAAVLVLQRMYDHIPA